MMNQQPKKANRLSGGAIKLRRTVGLGIWNVLVEMLLTLPNMWLNMPNMRFLAVHHTS
jgi:hypothetical protein